MDTPRSSNANCGRYLLRVLAIQGVVLERGRHVGKLEFEGSYPTDDTIKILNDERDFQRATQASIWALPLVGMANWQ
jgi:hypothetical protein